MYIELESAKMANSRFESMNEEEIVHLLDDKIAKTLKKSKKTSRLLFETSPHPKGT